MTRLVTPLRRQRALHLGGTCALAAVLLGGCISVPSDDEKVAVGSAKELTVPLTRGDALELHVPAGEVTVRAAGSGRAVATLSIRCPERSRRCRDWAHEANLQTVEKDDVVRLGFKQPSRTHASVRLDVQVPTDVPLSVFMKYGDLRIDGVERDVHVRMKAGSVAVNMPRSAVREAHLAARFGDASLHIRDATLEGRRPTLVGARVDWVEGPGDHEVDAKLRYGDIQLTLLP